MPYLLLAQVNYEFPALVGGAIGLALSVLLARGGIGLIRSDKSQSAGQAVPFLQVVKAMTPDPAADCYSDSDTRPPAGP